MKEMTNIVVIVLLLIMFSILPILRTDLSILYILQLKEYRRDRMKDFLSNKEGIKFFFNKYLMIYSMIILFFVLSYFFLNNTLFWILSWIWIGIMFLDNLLILYKIKNNNLLVPKKTKRAGLLFLTTIFVQFLIFLLGYFNQHFILSLFILFLSPHFIIIFINLSMLPIILRQKNKIMKLAEQKMQKLDILSIGITGSFGKSSVKNLLVQLLKTKFKVVNTPENVNTEMGVSQVILDKVNKKYDIFVAEMGAYKTGEIALLSKIVNNKYGFVTGIGNQHIGLFGSQDNIFKAKFEIANPVKNKNGNLYVNIDSISCIGNDIISYSIKNKEAKAYSDIKKTTKNKTEFVFYYKDKSRNLETNLLGDHQILNLTGVLACCVDLNVNLEEIKKELLQLKQIKSTLEIKELKSGVKIIDDSYNLSVDGLFAGVKFIQNFDEKKYLVIDDIIELGKESKKVHIEIGKRLAKYDFEKIFLVGKNYAKYIREGLNLNQFDEKKIFSLQHTNMLKTITKGIILLEGRNSKKFL